MKICRVVLTVVLLLVLLAMKALIFLCLFLTAVSSGLLSIVSSLLGMTALVSMSLIPMKSALILFVSAWLISPAGLPLAAQKLLEVLYVGCERMQDWMMGRMRKWCGAGWASRRILEKRQEYIYEDS